MRPCEAALTVVLAVCVLGVARSAYTCKTGETALDLRNQGLTQINTTTFINCATLTSLDLSHNQITSVAVGSLSGLSSLTSLDLSYNDLTVDEGSFDGLHALRNLNLYWNQITTTITNETFRGLYSLTTFNGGGSNIATITDGSLSALVDLRTLILNVTAISSMPSAGALLGLGNLTMLDISGLWNGLADPCGLALDSLTTLHLGQNYIQALGSGCFSSLLKLKSLDLSSNYLQNLASGTFTGLTQLTSLDLSNNRLQAFTTDGFLGLSSLTSLKLTDSMTNLNVLEPGCFNGLSSLPTLELSLAYAYAPAHTLRTGVFQGLQNLSSLQVGVMSCHVSSGSVVAASASLLLS